MPAKHDFSERIEAATTALAAAKASLASVALDHDLGVASPKDLAAAEQRVATAAADLDRLELMAAEQARRNVEAQAAAEAARIAAMEAEYAEARDRIHKANLTIAESIVALAPIGQTLVEDGNRARWLARQLGYGGRDINTLGPSHGHLEAVLRAVTGSLYTGRPDHHAAASLAALRRPWRQADSDVAGGVSAPAATVTGHAATGDAGIEEAE